MYNNYMENITMTLTTPALLFPAISLLLLAYTNRYLTLAALIRSLLKEYKLEPEVKVVGQINNLRKRFHLIRTMQALGVSAFFMCVFSMLLLFVNQILYGQIAFGVSLVFLLVSLGLSLWEIHISAHALELQLSDICNKKECIATKTKDS